MKVKGEILEMKRYSKSGYQRDKDKKQRVEGDNQPKLRVIKTQKRKSVNLVVVNRVSWVCLLMISYI